MSERERFRMQLMFLFHVGSTPEVLTGVGGAGGGLCWQSLSPGVCEGNGHLSCVYVREAPRLFLQPPNLKLTAPQWAQLAANRLPDHLFVYLSDNFSMFACWQCLALTTSTEFSQKTLNIFQMKDAIFVSCHVRIRKYILLIQFRIYFIKANLHLKCQ